MGKIEANNYLKEIMRFKSLNSLLILQLLLLSDWKCWVTGTKIAYNSTEISRSNIRLPNNGISLAVYQLGSAGSDAPTVLLLHGWPECWYSWRYQMAPLHKAGFHVIAIDFRGYGNSSAPESFEKYTSMHQVADIIGLLDALSLKQVFVIGHDWGSQAGWDLCLLRPDRVKAFVAVSVPYTPRSPTTYIVRESVAAFGKQFYMERFQAPGRFEGEIAAIGTVKALRTIFATTIIQDTLKGIPMELAARSETVGKLPSYMSEEDLQHYADQFEYAGFASSLNYYRVLKRSWELKAAWPQNVLVHTPALFVGGDTDLVRDFPGMKHLLTGGGLKAAVPNLEAIVTLKGGHFIHEEQHEKFNEIVIKYLKEQK